MLDKINTKTPYQLYMFGFSAGAQFVHRFALLNPEITIAVHAHAAGGYTYPQEKINTRFLISVGQNDTDRLSKAQYFYNQCVYFNIQAELIIYPNLGHELTQKQIDDGQNYFLEAIPNQPPIANNDSKVVKGTLSSDPNGDPLTYFWTQKSGPSVILSDPNSSITTFIPNKVGIYKFNLIVNDGKKDSTPDLVIITVYESNPNDTNNKSSSAKKGCIISKTMKNEKLINLSNSLRDKYLSKNIIGKYLISKYYKISTAILISSMLLY